MVKVKVMKILYLLPFLQRGEEEGVGNFFSEGYLYAYG
jgi:hypothetical protein